MDYYQNTNQNTSNQPTRNGYSGFSIASVVFGILSLLTWCTAVLPIPLGALGIIFAFLTYRRGRVTPPLSIVGFLLSCGGFIIGVAFTIYIVFNIMIPLMTDPAFFEEMNTYYKSIYGVGLEELMGNNSLSTLISKL